MVVEHIETAVLLGAKIIDKNFGDADDADAGRGLGDLDLFSAEVIAFVDRDGGVVEVDVGPSEGSGLAAAEAGVEQEHGGSLSGVGCLTDPALLLFSEGVARLRRSPGGGDGLDQRVVHHDLRDGEVIRGLGAAAQVGEGEVGERRLAVMPVGQVVEHLLEVGRAQLRRRDVHQFAQWALLVASRSMLFWPMPFAFLAAMRLSYRVPKVASACSGSMPLLTAERKSSAAALASRRVEP